MISDRGLDFYAFTVLVVPTRRERMSAFEGSAGSVVPDSAQKCNSCRAIFSSIDKVKEHYRGDWHIFNSKRRAHGLEPLSKADFRNMEKTDRDNIARGARQSTVNLTDSVSKSGMHRVVSKPKKAAPVAASSATPVSPSKPKLKKSDTQEIDIPLSWGGT